MIRICDTAEKFSVLENGFCQSNNIATRAMTVDKFILNVIQNPAKDEILELHTLHKVNDAKRYTAIKQVIRCIKPHGIFCTESYKDEKGKDKAKSQLVAYSGFIYFEIDFDKLPATGTTETKGLILELYGDKIFMMGISAGGKGVWFWIRVNIGDTKITPENFLLLQKYFIEKVFSKINIDSRATGLSKNQVIPYDENLYYNERALPVPYPQELFAEMSSV